MKWSSHKSYLKELGAANLPVVETLWVEKAAVQMACLTNYSGKKLL